ncbi:hypothetical protein EN794_004535 [Mesorhizobium sp. M00.F.Ca.ET.151.01.1.1]|nr:hypothetical protein EN842_05190 [bacterium M00.F.Ca.ET.199.01.1.1]TGT08741.1 hypothetical protein EN820_00375 [bacterium M00.F.Ca.ET.177.01.1.1]TGT66675.1 hypothetical protein EN813_000375 [Mesorhizobium sp. M00.F.Ca.ET.170.01.1.1]TGU15588.1 hypothetical protein EN806_00375 [bacterium M00.F.Ca.ET.163.01.1.1]TGU98314.1 hypothetical protein EN794_004535 [Mesorhizobium sp. M00.F.Ca.ET.151.01.1.1]TGV59980.1 hypothetical protein EN784_05925 [bacterium M00.F.Ca.ET.141.01.1.1]
MKIQQAIMVATLLLAPAVAFADEESPARLFLQEVNGSFVSCARLVGESDRNARLYGQLAPSSTGKIGDCANNGRDRVKKAFDSYVASQPDDAAKASAKSVYAASLAYADAIAHASTRSDLDNGLAQAELSKAKSMFVIESGL